MRSLSSIELWPQSEPFSSFQVKCSAICSVVRELLGEERLFQGDEELVFEELVFEQELGSFGYLVV